MSSTDDWQLIHPAVAQELLNALRFYVGDTNRPLHPGTKRLIEECLRSTGANKGQPSPGSPADRHDPDVLALSYREAARRLFVSASTVERLVARGQLPGVTVRVEGNERGNPRIRTADLEHFVASLPTTKETS